MKCSELFLDSPTAGNVVELCPIRDNIVICNTINNEDICKLINLLACLLLESNIYVRSVICIKHTYIIIYYCFIVLIS